MEHAFFYMSGRSRKNNVRISSKTYERIRKVISTRMRENNPLKNEQSRIKLSNSKIGSIPWNKGTTGLMPEPWNKGRKMSEETCMKISLNGK